MKHTTDTVWDTTEYHTFRVNGLHELQQHKKTPLVALTTLEFSNAKNPATGTYMVYIVIFPEGSPGVRTLYSFLPRRTSYEAYIYIYIYFVYI